jgi:hypothetical protein
VPYGFDRVLIDERGEEVERFARGQQLRLRKLGWHIVLSPIPEDDPDPARQLERQTTLWLLETFAGRYVSYRWLAEQLNLRDVPAPGNAYGPRLKAGWRQRGHDERPTFEDDPAAFTEPTRWNVPAVKRILLDPVYKGVARTGERATGKYHRLIAGQVTAVEPGAGKVKNTEGLILAPLEYGGYVEPPVWDAIQAKMAERDGGRMRPRVNSYVLPAGILRCGHCGGKMYGATPRPRRGEKAYEYVKYTCGTPNAKPGTCKHYSVDEDEIVGLLRDQLLRVYLSPERLAGIEQALKAQAESRHDRAPDDVERLTARLATLDQGLVKARRRTLQAKDDDTFAELNEGLRDMVAERQRLAEQLKAAQGRLAGPAAAAAEEIDAALRRVWALRAVVENAQGRTLGEAIRGLVSRADLYFDEEHKGGQRGYSFVRGAVKVRPLLDVSGFVTLDR